MSDILNFTVADMTACGKLFREFETKSKSMEEVAASLVNTLYNDFINKSTNEKNFVLVRFFKTHSYGKLPPELQDFLIKTFGDKPGFEDKPTHDTKCLTLLATRGDKPEWNDRRKSGTHQAIPLYSEILVSKLPMVSGLIDQFGLSVSEVIKPDRSIQVGEGDKTYNVFYVPRAKDSKFIPAQEDFVIPSGVESVLGFGGLHPNGDMFGIIIFSRVPIPENVAVMFKTISLSVKTAIISFEDRVFSS
ncbi:hypothetical protein QUF80_00765 [Desulfococcaceae bacterium HSG8]|nr:hypothetical protein [Desulfococcaceae bacterium HSG8]